MNYKVKRSKAGLTPYMVAKEILDQIKELEEGENND
jgi:hypothetical protein